MRKRSEEELGDEGPWGVTEDGRYDPQGLEVWKLQAED